MASISSSISPASSSLSGFDIIEFPLVAANTEYTFVLPAGVKNFCLKNRDPGIMKLRKTSAGPYFTLHQGVPYYITGLIGATTLTIYIESTKPLQTVEILYWS